MKESERKREKEKKNVERKTERERKKNERKRKQMMEGRCPVRI